MDTRRSRRLASYAVTEEIPDDGRVGKKIHPSLVIPPITRPMLEPRALEVLDVFEGSCTLHFNPNSDAMKRKIPDIKYRSQYVDIDGERLANTRHIEWAYEKQRAARCG